MNKKKMFKIICSNVKLGEHSVMLKFMHRTIIAFKLTVKAPDRRGTVNTCPCTLIMIILIIFVVL